MPWKESSPVDQKTQFISEYLRHTISVAELCRRYGVSRKTGYKWIDRYETDGPSGLDDRSRRPITSPFSMPQSVADAIIAARRHHPHWGSKKLLRILADEHPDWRLPSRRAASDLLRRQGLVRRRARPRKPGHPGKPTTVASAPNQLWCVDFKGHFRTLDGRYCYPLTVTDAFSRYLLACTALASTESAPVQAAFLQLFRRYGLPDTIKSDNGTPFASTALGRLSHLSVLWILLGIRPELIQPGKPQQNGQHERFHRTLKAEACRPPKADLTAQQRAFDRFRREFNHDRPHEGIGLERPATLFAASPRPVPKQIGTVSYPPHFETRLVSTNGGIRWRSQWVAVTTTCAGHHVGLEQVDHQIWDVYFGPIKLGRLLEDRLRIEDDRARLTRRHV
jgi:transposase InsO family protein